MLNVFGQVRSWLYCASWQKERVDNWNPPTTIYLNMAHWRITIYTSCSSLSVCVSTTLDFSSLLRALGQRREQNVRFVQNHFRRHVPDGACGAR